MRQGRRLRQDAGIPDGPFRSPKCADYGMSGILSTMRVQVLFFGQLKDLVGRSAETLPLGDRATVSDVLQHYAAKYPSISGLSKSWHSPSIRNTPPRMLLYAM